MPSVNSVRISAVLSTFNGESKAVAPSVGISPRTLTEPFDRVRAGSKTLGRRRRR